MSLSYLKGLKTRFRNSLNRELSKVASLVSKPSSDEDLDRDILKTNALLYKLKDLLSKFEDACERYVVLAEEKHAKEELVRVQELETDEAGFVDSVLDSIAELSALENQLLQSRSTKAQPASPSLLDENLTKLVDLQTKMQQQTQILMDVQRSQIDQEEKGRQQTGNGNRQASTVSVKLPTLEMSTFTGDILAWNSFWDVFVSVVHTNSKLSPVEKFSYLRSKLSGDAFKMIAGISLSSANYEVPVKLLRERYGDIQAIINAHYTCLMDLPASTNNTGKLRLLYDELEKHLRSLDASGESVNQGIFVSLITSKLPREVLVFLELQKDTSENWTVKKLRELLRNYILARETADRQSSDQSVSTVKQKEITKSGVSFNTSGSGFNRAPLTSSAGALMVGQGELLTPRISCRYCEQLHWSGECPIYSTVQDRKERIKGSCFICLRKGHRYKDCKSEKSCFYCHQRKNHHRSLCPKKFPYSSVSCVTSEFPIPSYPSEPSMLSTGEIVLMQTALTEVRKPNARFGHQTRILLDTGSQRTYITTHMVNKLKLNTERDKEDITIVTFGSEKPQVIKTSVTTLEVQLKDGTLLTIRANVVPKITGTIHRLPINLTACHNWNILCKNMPLADTLPTETESSSLDLLIGNDYYLDLILPQKIELSPGMYLLGSRLGWILSGRCNQSTARIPESGLLMLSYGQQEKTDSCMYLKPDASLQFKPSLEEFWTLETIGITDPDQNLPDDNVLKAFNQTISLQEGRYMVTWPWKEANPELPDNYGLAHGRFKSLMCKLSQNKDLFLKYSAILKEQEKKGIIEKVMEQSVEGARKHYISHHPVITPSKVTTKVRIVYDRGRCFVKGRPPSTDLATWDHNQRFNASRDGRIRAASILLPSKNIINRPLCLLYPVECSDAAFQHTNPLAPEIAKPTRTSGKARVAAIKARQLSQSKFASCRSGVSRKLPRNWIGRLIPMG